MDNFYNCCIPDNSALFIPESFEECFTYELQILWLKNYVDSIDPSAAPDLTDVKQRLANVEADIRRLDSEIDDIDLSGINAEIDAINNQLQSITDAQNTQAANIAALQSGKQDKLTAGDNITLTPQADGSVKISSTGGGSGGEITLDDTVTETSANGVKSSGIYTAIQQAKQDVQDNVDTLSDTVAEHTQQITDLTDDKQDKLTAGDNITLTPQEDGSVKISSTGGGGGGGSAGEWIDSGSTIEIKKYGTGSVTTIPDKETLPIQYNTLTGRFRIQNYSYVTTIDTKLDDTSGGSVFMNVGPGFFNQYGAAPVPLLVIGYDDTDVVFGCEYEVGHNAVSPIQTYGIFCYSSWKVCKSVPAGTTLNVFVVFI